MSDDLARFVRQMEAISDNMGIYPAAVKGYNDERDYEQRDGFKNGWNECVMEYQQKVMKALYDSQKEWSGAEAAFATDELFRLDEGEWSVRVSDTWYYACADSETIPKDQYDAVLKLYQEWGYAGVLYWVYLQRKTEPQVRSAWERFDLVRKFIESRKK